jgi:hypothetical protein
METEKAYLIVNTKNKKFDFKNLFLDYNNAIKYLNQLNIGIYINNLNYLKSKLERINKEDKRTKIKNIIKAYKHGFNLLEPMIKENKPLYLNSILDDKIKKKLKYSDYYITEVNLKKKEEEKPSIASSNE